MSIVEQLRALRLDRGMRQQDVAAVVGVSRPQIANIEAGVSGVRLATIEAWASVFGLRVILADAADTTLAEENIRLRTEREAVRHAAEQMQTWLDVVKFGVSDGR